MRKNVYLFMLKYNTSIHYSQKERGRGVVGREGGDSELNMLVFGKCKAEENSKKQGIGKYLNF